MDKKIPQIIHYCWFGNSKLDLISKKCIKTWEKYLPEYEIIEWNENNFSIETAPQYVREAYKAGKFAFVSDYVRLEALYKFGGVYLDTDIEVVKSFDDIIQKANFTLSFFETMPMTAFMSTVKGNPLIGKMLEYYNARSFIKEDGSYDMTPIDYPFNDVMKENGLVNNGNYQIFGDNYICYPNEYFCSCDTIKWKILYQKNTYTVHHFAGSWVDKTLIKRILHNYIKPILITILGFKLYYKFF